VVKNQKKSYSIFEIEFFIGLLPKKLWENYLQYGNNNRRLAFAFYRWNYDLSREFWDLIAILELAILNTIEKSLQLVLGDNAIRWCENKIKGINFNQLTFGDLIRIIENTNIRPQLRTGLIKLLGPTRASHLLLAIDKLKEVQMLRNFIAHHRTILHLDLLGLYKNIMQVIGILVPDNWKIAVKRSALPEIIKARPRLVSLDTVLFGVWGNWQPI
jgi:hypothetical protein